MSKERNNLLWTVDGLGIPNRAGLGVGKYHTDHTFFISAGPLRALSLSYKLHFCPLGIHGRFRLELKFPQLKKKKMNTTGQEKWLNLSKLTLLMASENPKFKFKKSVAHIFNKNSLRDQHMMGPT